MEYAVKIGDEDGDSFTLYFACYHHLGFSVEYEWYAFDTEGNRVSKEDMLKVVKGENVSLYGLEILDGYISLSPSRITQEHDVPPAAARINIAHRLIADQLERVFGELIAKGYYYSN